MGSHGKLSAELQLPLEPQPYAMQTLSAEDSSLRFAEDTVTVVTGSSRGLGLGFVKRILETTKSKVIATARKPQASKPLQALSKQHPNRLTLLTLDTEDESSIRVRRSLQPCRPCMTGVPGMFVASAL